MNSDQRAPTGIPGLDEVLHGGIITNHSYLIVGAAGTGKTVASLQWLLDGARQGTKGMYVTLAEPVENIKRNIASFGWNLDEIDILDLNPVDEHLDESINEYNIFPPSEVERAPLWQGIYQAVKERQPRRIVIDSVTQLRYLSIDDYQFRKQILALVTFLHRHGCTSFLTYEPSELEQETSVALAVDGIMRLRMEVSPRRVVGLRSLQVEKLRGSDFMSGFHPLRISNRGMHIYPHRIEAPEDVQPAETILTAGIPDLDKMLGGGLESGTATIISGPCGAGKTTLGVQFMAAAVGSGKRAVLYTFEESPGSIINRAQGVNIPVREILTEDAFSIVRVNPMELYPDEFLEILRHAVEEDGREVVMIDSLRGYKLAMEEFGSPIAHVHNLVTYLNRKQVTTLFINEVENITGNLVATEMGVSYIVDNIILLRYAEYQGGVIKVIGCLKKRNGPFETTLRRFHITSRGIELSEPLTSMRGILAGTPHTEKELDLKRP